MFTSKSKSNFIAEEQEHLPCTYDVAVSWYQKKAEQGDVKAQNHLGWMYKYGNGVAKDEAVAVKWYAKSAAQNNAKGQYNLGLMFEQGLGVLKDYVAAIECYKKAAIQEYVEAIFRLGFLYEHGLGVPKHYGIAVAYYRKAADEGFTEAQYCMGFMYEHGYGVIKNYATAINYYKLAIEDRHPEALYRLGLMYEYGLGVQQDNQLAFLWYKKASEQNNLDATTKLSTTFLIHKFSCSRLLNGNNQVPGKYIDNIPAKENYLSATMIITYEGSEDIGNRIIIATEINNPYYDIYTEVMTTSADKSSMFSCVDCLCMPIAKYSYFFNAKYQEKLNLINARCEQFWQKKEQELLKQADHIVNQIMQRRNGFMVLQEQQLEVRTYHSCSTDSSDSSDSSVSAEVNVPKCSIN